MTKLNLSSIMVGTSQPKELAYFYEKVFDREPDMDEGGWKGWIMGDAFFSIGAHSEVKGKNTQPARLIFNFETEDVKEEFNRLKVVGAVVIKEPYEMGDGWIATLCDPDGNYFQLMTPWVDDDEDKEEEDAEENDDEKVDEDMG
ncbi:MAG: VOC family protein [Patescibacteria group bacterium]